MAILTELRDPRIQDVTVTFVELSGDLRNAKVHVSIMGDEAKQQLSLHGLQNACGFLQQKIGERIDTRYTPRLKCVLDKGVQHSLEVTRILDEVLPSSDADGAEPDTVEAKPTPDPEAEPADGSVTPATTPPTNPEP